MKKILSLFSIGIIFGFVAGFIDGSIYILMKRYVQYRMFRLAVLTFQDSLNKYTILAILISLVLLLIWFLVLFVCHIGKRFVSVAIEINIKGIHKIKERIKLTLISIARYDKKSGDHRINNSI